MRDITGGPCKNQPYINTMKLRGGCEIFHEVKTNPYSEKIQMGS
jgi:hypothetical protein